MNCMTARNGITHIAKSLVVLCGNCEELGFDDLGTPKVNGVSIELQL